MPSEQDEFLKDLDPKNSQTNLEAPLVEGDETPEAEAEEEEVDTEESRAPNRRERRLQAKLTAEREASIAMAARLQAITEAQQAQRESAPSEYLKKVERIYGTNSPEAIEASQLLAESLQAVEERATERAIERIRAEQEQEREAVAQEERSLDEMIEDLEDTYDIELDGNARKGFFQLLERLSPKDRDGNIIAYADHHAVFDEYKARQKPDTSRAKDLAARSMARTGASPKKSVEVEANERWLIDNGLI